MTETSAATFDTSREYKSGLTTVAARRVSLDRGQRADFRLHVYISRELAVGAPAQRMQT